MSDGFTVDNLAELDSILRSGLPEVPAMVQRIMESLGEELLNFAKEHLRSTNTSHAVFKAQNHKISRGPNKGKNRIEIAYAGSESRNSIDTGNLWNSLTRGRDGNAWQFHGASENYTLQVGSTLKYARWVHDGYTIDKDHWVPGVVDSNGIFRYQKGATSGIMARARSFEGIAFFEVALSDLERIAPDIVQYELHRLFRGYAV